METQSQTDEEWTPADSPQQMALIPSDEAAPKRRRPVRKRKRRPVYETEDDSYPDRLPVRSRNRRPQRLDHRREQWFDEMMAEEPYRPLRNYNRRRLYPKYDDDDSSRDTEESPERIRDPYTALEEEQSSRSRSHPKRKYQHRTFEENLPESTDRVDTEPSNPIDLKTLLKQSGNISLSELLQQKNLSLSDLLKGELHAISALTEQPETEEQVKQNRRPSKQNISSTTSEPLESSTTERRIFVPSHPKYYTSVDYKPLMNFSPETTETTSQSTSIVSSTVTFSTSEQPLPVKLKLAKNRTRNALPTTLAKLKTLSAKTTMKTNTHVPTLPPKAIQININEIFGVANLFNATSSTETPIKITSRSDEIGKQEKQDNASKKIHVKQQESGDFNKVSIENTTPVVTDTGEVKARDELIEILSDSASRANLTRLLKVRNMTLEELIEQRERGSSQKHLADIFHNQTKEPEASEETIVQEVIKTSGPFYQQSLFGGSYFPENNKQRESRNDQLTDLDSYKVIANSVYQTTPPPKEVINKFLPLWRQAYNTLNQNEQKLLSERLPDDELIISDEAQRIEDIENRLADAVNGALNVDVLEHKSYDAASPTDDEDSDFFRLPQGVRSAIIASAVIGGLSLFVFLTIFIIFKWTQRHRKHLSYTSSFSGSKIKTPILQAPYQKRIFNSLMNNTLGRKKKICTIYNDPQSLQEYLWETDRKPFQ